MGINFDSRFLGATGAPVALLVSLALLAGCGSSDETSTTTTADVPTGELTKSKLIATADGYCTDATARIAADADPPSFSPEGPTPEEIKASAPFWSATAKESAALVDQLSALQPPKDEQKQWDEFVKMLDAGTVDYSNQLLGPANDSDPDTFFSVAQAEGQQLAELAAAGHELGLKVCGASDLPSS
jgi:hypothetical protein